MLLRRTSEPETLAAMVEASLTERNQARRALYEQRLKDLEGIYLLEQIAEFLKIESRKEKDLSRISMRLNFIYLGLLPIFGVLAIYNRWGIALIISIGVPMPISIFDLLGAFRKAVIDRGLKKMVNLVRQSPSAECVGPVLDVLATGLETAQQAELLKSLGETLYRMDAQQAALLSGEQRKTLEKFVFEGVNSNVTIVGLLVLGSAGYRVAEWATVAFWAKAPDRRGTAAREYLSAMEAW
jgi:hypothetical protein